MSHLFSGTSPRSRPVVRACDVLSMKCPWPAGSWGPAFRFKSSASSLSLSPSLFDGLLSRLPAVDNTETFLLLHWERGGNYSLGLRLHEWLSFSAERRRRDDSHRPHSPATWLPRDSTWAWPACSVKALSKPAFHTRFSRKEQGSETRGLTAEPRRPPGLSTGPSHPPGLASPPATWLPWLP